MKVEKEMKMKTNYSDLVKQFVDLSYKVYGNYAHSSGYLQSLTSNLLDGYTNKEFAVKMLKQSIAEFEDRLNYEDREKQFEMMSRDAEVV
jgi:serine/threonine-protein kinase RIO1